MRKVSAYSRLESPLKKLARSSCHDYFRLSLKTTARMKTPGKFLGIFLSQIHPTLASTLRSHGVNDLKELAQLVEEHSPRYTSLDSFVSSTQSASSSAFFPPRHDDRLTTLRTQMQELTIAFSKLQTQLKPYPRYNASRPQVQYVTRSKTNWQPPYTLRQSPTTASARRPGFASNPSTSTADKDTLICFYHKAFGNKARKCRFPCSFIKPVAELNIAKSLHINNSAPLPKANERGVRDVHCTQAW